MRRKGIVAFLYLSFITRCFALEITKMVEVTPHLQLVKFEKPLAFIQEDKETSSKAVRKLSPFAMNKYETTYCLWYDAIEQSKEYGYHIHNVGRPGSHGKNGSRTMGDNVYLPVANISWYDAIVWLNAYSELQGRTPCYTYNDEVLKDSREKEKIDNCVCNFNVNGFRLPTEAEWEYASRITTNGLQWGHLVSGQTSEDVHPEDYCWSYKKATTSHIVGTSGSLSNKKGSGYSNGAGLYDMSGNLMEFCFDRYGPYNTNLPYGMKEGEKRVYRGGSWSSHNMNVFTEQRMAYDPSIIYPYAGFRIACSLVD